MVVFGGWNKTALTSAFLINKKDDGDDSYGRPPTHELRYIPNGLDKPDFFLITGIAMKVDQDKDRVRVCGHSQIFTFDKKNYKFEGSANA